jgi:AcrR family transcriptional regulator
MAENQEIWVKAGYEIFALSGESGLKIETLARTVGISKSSFYHHFADLKVFMGFLMTHHLQQSKNIAEKEKKVENIDPELIHILLEHKTDLLFNRQLRFNQQNKLFKETLEKSNRIIGDMFVSIWAKTLKTSLNQTQITSLYELALENFYLQINPENINYRWLSGYFKELTKIARSVAG